MEQNLLYSNSIKLSGTRNGSSEASVYIGSEVESKAVAVVKRYRTERSATSFLRELHIFTLIEANRYYTTEAKRNQDSLMKRMTSADGFPRLLGFKFRQSEGEILMENCGFNLTVWQRALKNYNDRKLFVCEMIR